MNKDDSKHDAKMMTSWRKTWIYQFHVNFNTATRPTRWILFLHCNLQDVLGFASGRICVDDFPVWVWTSVYFPIQITCFFVWLFWFNAELSIFIQLPQLLAVASEAELWQHLRSKLVSQRQGIFFLPLVEGHFNKPCNFEDHSVAKVQKEICPCCHPKVSPMCRPFVGVFRIFPLVFLSLNLPELHERRGRPGEVPCLLEELDLVIFSIGCAENFTVAPCNTHVLTTFDGSKLFMEWWWDWKPRWDVNT